MIQSVTQFIKKLLGIKPEPTVIIKDHGSVVEYTGPISGLSEALETHKVLAIDPGFKRLTHVRFSNDGPLVFKSFGGFQTPCETVSDFASKKRGE